MLFGFMEFIFSIVAAEMLEKFKDSLNLNKFV